MKRTPSSSQPIRDERCTSLPALQAPQWDLLSDKNYAPVSEPQNLHSTLMEGEKKSPKLVQNTDKLPNSQVNATQFRWQRSSRQQYQQCHEQHLDTDLDHKVTRVTLGNQRTGNSCETSTPSGQFSSLSQADLGWCHSCPATPACRNGGRESGMVGLPQVLPWLREAGSLAEGQGFFPTCGPFPTWTRGAFPSRGIQI